MKKCADKSIVSWVTGRDWCRFQTVLRKRAETRQLHVGCQLNWQKQTFVATVKQSKAERLMKWRGNRVSSGVSTATRRSVSFQSKSRISYQHPLWPECYSFPCVMLFILGLFYLFCAFHILSLAAWLELTHFALFRSISRNSNLMGLLSSFL